MKKAIRFAFFTLLVLAGSGMLIWYFIMKRRVPEHAHCIPKNAMAVVTLNLREIVLDRSGDKHLFPELAGKTSKTLEPFLKAIERNDGAGLKETADVLAFMYQDGDAAFIGVAARVNDSAKFGRLVRKELAKEMNVVHLSASGNPIVGFDTSAVTLGWSNDVALLLYPFSNTDISETSRQCTRLLSQTENASILSDENFKTHELTAFDAGAWIHIDPFRTFMGNGAQIRMALDGLDYVSYAIDFRDGEVDARCIITGNKPFTDQLQLITGDASQVMGFWHHAFHFEDASLQDAFASKSSLADLPFDEEQIKQLIPQLDGNYTLLFHDTISYDMPYVAYEYDEDFNQVARTAYKRVTTRATSFCFGLKNAAAAKKLIASFAAMDSVPAMADGWNYSDNGLKKRILISENILTITSWPQSDGKKRAVPANWEAFDLFLPVGDYLKTSDLSDAIFFFPKLGNGQDLFVKHLGVLSISKPLAAGNTRSADIRLKMTNDNVNALVQLEELIRKSSGM